MVLHRPGRLLLHHTLDDTWRPHGMLPLAQCQAESTPISMKTTGGYGDELLAHLCAQDFLMSKLNPAQVKHFAYATLNRNKDDRVDAEGIAHLVKKMKTARTPQPNHLRLRHVRLTPPLWFGLRGRVRQPMEDLGDWEKNR